MVRKLSFLMLSVMLLCTSCASSMKEQVKPEESEKKVRQFSITNLDPRIVKASNSVGLQIYREITLAQPGQNVFMSPLSVSSALAMVYNGAAGATETAMATALGLNEMTKEEVGQGYRTILDLLNHPIDPDLHLAVANSIWMRKGKTFHDDFVQRSQEDYAAEVNVLDFNSPSAIQTMNRWVKDHTNGKIPSIVDNIDPLSVLYVLNAVYFEGKWTEPFLPDSTRVSDFHISATDTVNVKMMSRGGNYEYMEEAGYQAIRLPFGKKTDSSMVILLPNKDEGLIALQERIAADPTLLTTTFNLRQGRLELPRVKFDYKVTLNEMLKTIGMSEAFNPEKADFSAMAPAPPNLFINNVEHKTFLEINEQGTTAAAATKVEILVGSAQPDNPFHMTVNRPFLIAIVDQETGSILFVGTVVNPNG
jgi:serine protease inhibitor